MRNNPSYVIHDRDVLYKKLVNPDNFTQEECMLQAIQSVFKGVVTQNEQATEITESVAGGARTQYSKDELLALRDGSLNLIAIDLCRQLLAFELPKVFLDDISKKVREDQQLSNQEFKKLCSIYNVLFPEYRDYDIANLDLVVGLCIARYNNVQKAVEKKLEQLGRESSGI